MALLRGQGLRIQGLELQLNQHGFHGPECGLLREKGLNLGSGLLLMMSVSLHGLLWVFTSLATCPMPWGPCLPLETGESNEGPATLSEHNMH